MKKILALLCILIMMLTMFPAAYAASGPSAADLRAIGSQIEYPKSNEYLDSYLYATVDAPGGHSVYCYGSADRKGSRYEVKHNEAVTILAERGEMACVIIDSQNKARWIKWEHLNTFGNPGLGGSEFGLRDENTVFVDGYYVEPWSDGDTHYFKVSKNKGEIGVPNFYCEKRDVYENRSTGSDIRITFFRRYDSATPEQASAFCRYLEQTTRAKNCYTFYYYYKLDDYDWIDPVYVVLFEGLDLERMNDYQPLWDRNPWVNSEGTQLELVCFFYGSSADYVNEYIRRENCSAAVWFEIDPMIGYFALGFRFTEGPDHHIVMRYCKNETW